MHQAKENINFPINFLPQYPILTRLGDQQADVKKKQNYTNQS